MGLLDRYEIIDYCRAGPTNTTRARILRSIDLAAGGAAIEGLRDYLRLIGGTGALAPRC